MSSSLDIVSCQVIDQYTLEMDLFQHEYMGLAQTWSTHYPQIKFLSNHPVWGYIILSHSSMSSSWYKTTHHLPRDFCNRVLARKVLYQAAQLKLRFDHNADDLQYEVGVCLSIYKRRRYRGFSPGFSAISGLWTSSEQIHAAQNSLYLGWFMRGHFTSNTWANTGFQNQSTA